MVDGDANQLGTTGHAAARIMRVDRRQILWAMLDVERLIDDDHPARAIWAVVGRLDLAGFTSAIASLEGSAGRPAYDPHLLISLWVYAYSRGIGSARDRRVARMIGVAELRALG